MQRVGQTGVVVKAGVAEGEVEAQSVAPRLADLPRLQLGQFVEVLADRGGDQPQQATTLAGGERSPLRKRPARVGDRFANQLGVAVDHARDLPPGGRLGHPEGRPIADVDPAARDERAPPLTRGARGAGHANRSHIQSATKGRYL